MLTDESNRRVASFRTLDGLTLRGWFYPSGPKAPCVILTHGLSCIKEMFLDNFASCFQGAGYAVLVYDNRNFGESEGYPRQEVDPVLQASDYSDAITYVSSLSDVDPNRIAIWGTSYSGGVVLRAGAVDRRLRAIISQVPFTSGSACSKRWIRPDDVEKIHKMVYDDRAARIEGGKPGEIPAVDRMLFGIAALPTLESYKWYMETAKKLKHNTWVNRVTLQSIFNIWGSEPVAYAALVSPTPLLMVVAEKDVLCGADLQLEAFAKAKEPKQLALLRGASHFDCYEGVVFENCIKAQIGFLNKYV